MEVKMNANIEVNIKVHVKNGEEYFTNTNSASFEDNDKFKSLLDVFVYAVNHNVRIFGMKEKPDANAGDSYIDFTTNNDEAYKFLKKNLKSLSTSKRF